MNRRKSNMLARKLTLHKSSTVFRHDIGPKSGSLVPDSHIIRMDSGGKMKILITGASGFVGHAVTQSLLENHEICVLSRSAESDKKVRDLEVQILRGQLGDPLDLTGYDLVIHCAAFVEQWGESSEFHRVNVEGTRQLLEDAKAGGVSRFIYISSEAVLLDGRPKHLIDEKTPYPDQSPFLYSRSKKDAELACLWAEEPGFEVVILRPRMIWGPGEQTFTRSIQKMADLGLWIWADHGQHLTSTTFIGNLVHAVELALQRGKSGEVYFVTDGPPVTLKRFFSAIMMIQNIQLPNRSVPGFVVRWIAKLCETIWSFLSLSSKPPLTRLAATFMSTEGTISIKKAEIELGYSPQYSFEKGLELLRASRSS